MGVAVEINGKKKEVSKAELAKAQKMRRRASQAEVSSHFSSTEGRRLSKLEQNLYVVEKAIALANTEEKEDEETGNKVELEEAPEKEKRKIKERGQQSILSYRRKEKTS